MKKCIISSSVSDVVLALVVASNFTRQTTQKVEIWHLDRLATLKRYFMFFSWVRTNERWVG